MLNIELDNDATFTDFDVTDGYFSWMLVLFSILQKLLIIHYQLFEIR